jgi:PleD family two-component response regulator
MKAMPPAPPPLPAESADSPAIEPTGARFAKPTDESSPFCVLVVEDQASVRTSLVSELLHAGVTRVLEAADGLSALALFREQRPDLVLLDIRLPGEAGSPCALTAVLTSWSLNATPARLIRCRPVCTLR